jgi:hypothetical protein
VKVERGLSSSSSSSRRRRRRRRRLVLFYQKSNIKIVLPILCVQNKIILS